MKTWKIAGLSFDHMHMGDLLREAHAHPAAEIVGVADENPANAASVAQTRERLDIPAERFHDNFQACLEATRPDLIVLCPATARHAELVEAVAPFGAHMLVEKPFAASLADADRMIAAARKAGTRLFINWPLAWYPPHLTTRRLIAEGVIGEVLEVHYYDGNRGPTRHLMDKVEVPEEEALRRMRETWWYRAAEGGGSLLDYLGYGTTLATWFMDGHAPIEVTTTAWARPEIEVDEYAVTVARYATGLSKFETRWGTFSDPWTHQPQPKCGFVVVGSAGTIASYDYAETVRVQTAAAPEGRDIPVDPQPSTMTGPLAHVLDVLENDTPVHGPLSLEICRTGQRIVDAAALSARERRPVSLDEFP